MSLDFLIEMGWKSALIAAAALATGFLLKARSAEDKAAMLRLAVGLILLLPFISLMGPALQMEAPIVSEALPAAAAPSYDIAPVPPGGTATAMEVTDDAAAPAPQTLSIFDNAELMAGLVYLAGVLLFGIRLMGGYVTLQRWTWAAREVESPHWRRALERARTASGDKRGTRLLLSDSVPAPLSWGWAQPVILIDPETFERPEDADAVLAHEMAHVVRVDWLALMLSRLSVVLFWFNPLVWLLEREMVQQSEEAADAKAVADVEPAHYAQTLMSCIMHSRSGVVPANSIRPSRSGLSRRIYAVLDGRARAIRSGSRWTLAAMLACTAFAAPLAALELIAPEPPAAPLAPSAPETPEAPEAPAAPAVPAAYHDGTMPPAPPAPPVPPAHGPSGIHSHVDAASIAAEVRAAQAEARQARATAMASLEGLDEEIRTAVAQSVNATAIAKAAHKEARKGLAQGAKDMERGARDMENGARDMEREAARLRSQDYRERQIAHNAARGHTVTHQQLIGMIPELKEGAREMRKGAEEMREGAREMEREARSSSGH
jgi:beta-lactamase regulating signal transducer with metallopeptidase domain